MALVFKDRVKETTTTSGTGTITLAGAVSGFQTFSAIGDGNTTYYTVVSGTDWEVGIGTYTLSGTTLSRDTILESSNGGSAISLSGTSTVFCTYAAEKSVYRNSNDQINVTASGLIFSDSTVQTTAAAVSGDNVSIFVNDASYLTAESDTLQTVVDRGNTSTTDITVSGLLTAATGVTLEQNTPATTTDKLYNVGGALYFNGSAVDTTYTAGSGLELSGTEFNAKTATTSASGITTLTNTIDATETKALTPKAVNDAGYITGTGNVNQVAIFDTTTSVSGAQGIEIETTGDPGLDIFRKSGQTTTLVNIYTESTGILTVIDENGYIGIGTGDPTYHLQVEGTGDFDTIRFSDGSLQTTAATGYLTSESDTLQTVVDRGNTSTTDITVSGLITAATGIALEQNTPATTTDKLYNVGGSLYFNGSAVDTTYTAGSGLELSGTTFNAKTATTSASGITTLTNTINGDQDKALTPKAVNDAGYLTSESDTLQTVVDRGSTSTTDITVSGLLTAATGVTLEQNTPATTTDKLYNVGGSLYFNGSAVDTTYTAGSGLQLNGTTFDALTATTSASGITTLTNTIDSTETKALTPKGVNDAGYVVGPASSTDNAIAVFDGTTGKLLKETGGLSVNSTGVLNVNGIQLGSTNFTAFDAKEFANVSSGSPVLFDFLDTSLINNYVYFTRLTNRQTTNPNGTSYIIHRNGVPEWEFIQISYVDGNSEAPVLIESGGSVYLSLVGAGGPDTIVAHTVAYRKDQGWDDGDTLSMFPELVFSNRKPSGALNAQPRKIFPTQDLQSTGYYFGLGTQTDPQAALDVGGNSLFSGTVSATGLITAATGVTLQQNTPATTTDKLYNIGGNLYFNGLQLATSTSADWTIADGNGNSEVVSSGDTIYFSGVAGTDVTYDAATNIVSISGGYNPVVTETGTSRNLVAGDAGLYIRTTNASAVTITVPSGLAPPANAEFVFEQAGAGQITISPAAGVTVNTSSSLTSSAQYAVLGIKEVATDVYTAFGDRT